MEKVKGKKNLYGKNGNIALFHFCIDESKKRRSYTNNIQGKYIQ